VNHVIHQLGLLPEFINHHIQDLSSEFAHSNYE